MFGRLLSFFVWSLFSGGHVFLCVLCPWTASNDAIKLCICIASKQLQTNTCANTNPETEYKPWRATKIKPYPKAKPPGNSKEWIESLLSIVLINFHLRNSVTSMTFNQIKSPGRKNTSVLNYPFLTKVWSSNLPVPHANCCGKNGSPLELAVGTKKSSKGSCRTWRTTGFGSQCPKL